MKFSWREASCDILIEAHVSSARRLQHNRAYGSLGHSAITHGAVVHYTSAQSAHGALGL